MPEKLAAIRQEIDYIKEHSKREYKVYKADDDAVYSETYEINLAEIKPTGTKKISATLTKLVL